MNISQSETHQYVGEMMVAVMLVPLFRTNKFLIIFNQFIHTVKLVHHQYTTVVTRLCPTAMSLICSGLLETCASHWEYSSTLKCHWPEPRHMHRRRMLQFGGAQNLYMVVVVGVLCTPSMLILGGGGGGGGGGGIAPRKILKIRCQEIEYLEAFLVVLVVNQTLVPRGRVSN